ncbi:MAG: DUF2382 domain-containing protein [Leptolyngbya sp. SIO4C1]|nr:DUF2382 domain-containing protein [Leptolyngbya sp. SIO4C1]
MSLVKFKDAYPNYRDTFGDSEAVHFDEYSVYTAGDEKVGSVKDALFERETGDIRYLIVDTGFWIFGKNVLLPVGLAHFDYDQRRVYVDGLTEEQVENLPEYHDDMTVDYEYEERVRGSYRPMAETRNRQFMGDDYQVDAYRAYPGNAAVSGATETTGVPANDYRYESEPGLYQMDEASHQPIRLYQERLIADKDRFKMGEVAIGKRVESETKEVSVPVEKERVVIERSTPTNPTPVAGTAPDFNSGEVARMEVHAEEANIHKEAFVREEVNVRKEVDRNVVSESETVRREELDVDTAGNPNVVER